jgi:hypothetical protein
MINCIFLMINMDDNIVTGKRFLDKEHYSLLDIFKPYRSFRKKFIQVLTTIVLDKFGIMRLRHEGHNYGGKTLIFR